MNGGLSQRARVMAEVQAEIDAYMRRPCARAHPSGLTEIQRINSDTRLKILARAEWDAMDERGQLPSDWPQRRAALIEHLQGLKGGRDG